MVNRTELDGGHMGIPHGGRDRTVGEELLDIARVHSLLHHEGRYRVADDMGGNSDRNSRIESYLSHHTIGVDIIHRRSISLDPQSRVFVGSAMYVR